MIALLIAGSIAALPTGADRLVTGSNWHCRAALPDDNYEAEFVIESGRRVGEKKLKITSAKGGLPSEAYAIGMARADRFEKNGSDLIAEFGQGFSNYGMRLLAQWDETDEGISLNVHTWNAAADTFAQKNEKSFLLACLPQSNGVNS